MKTFKDCRFNIEEEVFHRLYKINGIISNRQLYEFYDGDQIIRYDISFKTDIGELKSIEVDEYWLEHGPKFID